MTDASPRPWRVDIDELYRLDDWRVDATVLDATGDIVCALYSHDSPARNAEVDAALIVRAVNWLDRSDATLVSSDRWALMQAVIDAARAVDSTLQILNSGMTVIPFGEEQATWDAAADALRAAIDRLDGEGD